MFDFFKKKVDPNLQTLTMSLSGLHCTSCAVNIDLTLEDLPGIADSNTNYARSTLVVKYYPTQVSSARIKEEIEKLGYRVGTIF